MRVIGLVRRTALGQFVKKPRPVPAFVGLPAVPEICPRARCGQMVQVHRAMDPLEPVMWSCPVGHGGVVNTRPLEPAVLPQVEQGICRKCEVNPVPKTKIHGGRHRGTYCQECIDAAKERRDR